MDPRGIKICSILASARKMAHTVTTGASATEKELIKNNYDLRETEHLVKAIADDYLPAVYIISGNCDSREKPLNTMMVKQTTDILIECPDEPPLAMTINAGLFQFFAGCKLTTENKIVYSGRDYDISKTLYNNTFSSHLKEIAEKTAIQLKPILTENIIITISVCASVLMSSIVGCVVYLYLKCRSGYSLGNAEEQVESNWGRSRIRREAYPLRSRSQQLYPTAPPHYNHDPLSIDNVSVRSAV
jgi:hypothetical protein